MCCKINGTCDQNNGELCMEMQSFRCHVLPLAVIGIGVLYSLLGKEIALILRKLKIYFQFIQLFTSQIQMTTRVQLDGLTRLFSVGQVEVSNLSTNFNPPHFDPPKNGLSEKWDGPTCQPFFKKINLIFILIFYTHIINVYLSYSV